MSKKMRHQWVDIFNKTLADTGDESKAFKYANGVLKKRKKSMSAQDSQALDELIKLYGEEELMAKKVKAIKNPKISFNAETEFTDLNSGVAKDLFNGKGRITITQLLAMMDKPCTPNGMQYLDQQVNGVILTSKAVEGSFSDEKRGLVGTTLTLNHEKDLGGYISQYIDDVKDSSGNIIGKGVYAKACIMAKKVNNMEAQAILDHYKSKKLGASYEISATDSEFKDGMYYVKDLEWTGGALMTSEIVAPAESETIGRVAFSAGKFTFNGKDYSFNEIAEEVSEEIMELDDFQTVYDSNGHCTQYCGWLVRIYPDYCIWCQGDDYYKFTYSMGEDGEVTLGEPEEVELEEIWNPAPEEDVEAKKIEVKKDENILSKKEDVKEMTPEQIAELVAKEVAKTVSAEITKALEPINKNLTAINKEREDRKIEARVARIAEFIPFEGEYADTLRKGAEAKARELSDEEFEKHISDLKAKADAKKVEAGKKAEEKTPEQLKAEADAKALADKEESDRKTAELTAQNLDKDGKPLATGDAGKKEEKQLSAMEILDSKF